MRYQSSLIQKIFIVNAIALISFLAPRPTWAEDCQSALSGSGFDPLASGSSADKERRVEEWGNEVVKFHTDRPGLLSIEGIGPGSQGSLYGDAGSGPYPLVDSSQVGTNLQDLQAVIPAGDHCISVTPSENADPEDDFKIEATFTDVCDLAGMDDHGDSFLCATEITVGGGSTGGTIPDDTEDDVDVFTFELESAVDSPDTVLIVSTGTTNVAATLFDADGTPIASDDDGAGSPNFEIEETDLPAGRYYVRVERVGSVYGSYGIEVSLP